MRRLLSDLSYVIGTIIWGIYDLYWYRLGGFKRWRR